jgi:dynein heavy chain
VCPRHAPAPQLNLVFFEDAVKHLCRICRIIRQPRGSGLLIGIGGSGKQSLTRLASFICDSACMQIASSSTYIASDVREDMKAMMHAAGVSGKSVVFLVTDNQVCVPLVFAFCLCACPPARM